MEPVYVIVRTALVVLLRLFFRFKLFGVEKIPPRGPIILAPNHISNFDPLCVALLADAANRRPRFLAKASLWRHPLSRIVVQGCHQIPVERGSGDTGPVEAAEGGIRQGECVVIYPESTITRNADLMPMSGKTGVARLTLRTGAPVYPVAVWGAQWIAGKGRSMKYVGHRLVMMQVGDAMTFPDLEGRQDDPEVRREVTDRIMAEVDRMVRELQKIHPLGAAVPEFTS